MKLTKKDIESFSNLMYQKALDIDVALFNNDFNLMPKEYVLYAISMYQNKDGGFAHGLDIDNYNTNSTAYETYVALKTLYDAGYRSINDNEMLKEMLLKAFNYLYNKALPLDNLWNLKDKSNDKFACSEKFKDHGEAKDYFPTAGIIGYTLIFAESDKIHFKKALKMVDNAINYFLNLDYITYDMLFGFKILKDAITLRDIEVNNKLEFIEKVDLLIKNYTLTLDITEFNYDNILELYDSYKADNEIDLKIDESIDKMLDAKKSHGLWEMNHEWGNNYPEFDTAALKWVGCQSRKNLHYLKKFGKVEE